MCHKREWLIVLGGCALIPLLGTAAAEEEPDANVLSDLRKEYPAGKIQEPDSYVPRLRLEVNQTIANAKVSAFRYDGHDGMGYFVKLREGDDPNQKVSIRIRVLRSRREAIDLFLSSFGPLMPDRARLPGLPEGSIALEYAGGISVTLRNVNMHLFFGGRPHAEMAPLVVALTKLVEREAAANGVKVVPLPKVDFNMEERFIQYPKREFDMEERIERGARRIHVRITVPKGVEHEANVFCWVKPPKGVQDARVDIGSPVLIDGDYVIDPEGDRRIGVQAWVTTRDGYYFGCERFFPEKAEEKKAP